MAETTGAATDILAAAATLFAERGYKATTTRMIAEKAGVNEVTIFRRFGSKRGILDAIGDSWRERMAGFSAASLDPRLPAREALERLARDEVQQAREFGVLAMRLALDAPASPEVAEWLSAGSGSNFEGLRDFLAAKQRAGELRADLDPRVMAESFFALTSSLVLIRQGLGQLDDPTRAPLDETAHQALEIYLRGIGAA